MLYSTRTSRIYGLDILVGPEDDGDSTSSTSTVARDIRLLDPGRAVVRAAGVSTVDGDEFYEGDELRILRILDQRFAVLPTGVISTWNGSVIDLPFLRARAKVLGLDLGLRLAPADGRWRGNVRRQRPGAAAGSGAAVEDPAGGVTRGEVIGAVRPVYGAWHRQRHLDLCRIYRQSDLRSDLDTGTDELSGLDPRRGAHLARSLAERRWFRARRFVDRVPPARQLDSYTWTCMSPDYADGPAVDVLPG